ncbi:MAG: biopolymer transporter ExbD [Acidobacteria bacterium]|nr:biopolymer transporter ExbD [Acidobacteriota bacterium]
MGIGGIGGRAKGAMADPNIVPLIDILLVLIVIFMVVTPLTPLGLDTLVPQPSPDQPPDVAVQQRTIVIQVECSNPPTCARTNVKINQEDVTWDYLGIRLEEIFKTRAEKVAFVKGSEDLEFSHIARAIDIAKGAGVDKIGLITAKIEMGE